MPEKKEGKSTIETLLNTFFKETEKQKEVVDPAEKARLEKIRRDKEFWDKISLGIAKSINTALGGVLRVMPSPVSGRAKRLSIMPTKEQMAARKWESRIISPMQNKRQTEKPKERVPEADNGVPVMVINRVKEYFRSLGYTEKQIKDLDNDPKKAWETFQKAQDTERIAEMRKNIDRDLTDIKGETVGVEKNVTPDALLQDYEVLLAAWNDAVDRIADDSRANELMGFTAQTMIDAKPIEEYLKKEFPRLTPEEKFFLEISIEMKKFTLRAKEVIATETENNETATAA